MPSDVRSLRRLCGLTVFLTLLASGILPAQVPPVPTAELSAETAEALEAAAALREGGNYAEASALLEKKLSETEETEGRESLPVCLILERTGDLLLEMGMPEEALPRLQRALGIRKLLFSDQDPSIRSLHKSIGSCLQALGDQEKALDEYITVLGGSEEARETSNVLDKMWALDRIAGIHTLAGNDKEREKARKQLRAEVAQALHNVEREPAQLKALADILVETGFGAKSSGLYQTALVICQDRYGKDDSRTAHAAIDLARHNARMGDLDTARSLFEQEMSIHAREETPDQAELLEGLGEIDRRVGQLSQALELLQRALSLRERLYKAGSAHLGTALLRLGSLRAEMGSLEEARPLIDRGLAILEKQVTAHSELFRRHVLAAARSMRHVGADADAASLLDRLPPSDPTRPFSEDLFQGRDVLLAERYLREGRIEEAARPLMDVLQRAEERVNEKIGRNTRDYFTDMRLMLAGDEKAYRHGRFLDTYGPASVTTKLEFSSRQEPFRFGDPDSAVFFEIVGEVLMRSGRPVEAAAVERWAAYSLRFSFGATHPSVAALLDDLASSLWTVGDEAGLGMGRKILLGALMAAGSRLPGYPKEQFVYSGKGTTEGALGAAARSAELIDDSLQDVLSLLPEREALRLVGTRKHPEAILFSGVVYGSDKKRPRWLEACWNWALRRRALVLDELANRHRQVLESETPEAREAERDWIQARAHLATLWIRGSDREDPSSYAIQLQKAAEARDEAERALARLSASHRRAQAHRHATVQEIERALPPATALLEYVRVEVRPPDSPEASPHYIALIMSAGSREPAFADLGPAATIDDLVQDWQRQLRESFTEAGAPHVLRLDDILPAGERLRAAVWDPVANRIGKSDIVFIVPDGTLAQIHFPALPAGGGRFLIDDGPAFQFLSTARDLLRLGGGRPAPGPGGALVIGNPDYEAAPIVSAVESPAAESQAPLRGGMAACPVLARQRWADLPETEREIETIEGLLGKAEPVVLLHGAEASEENFRGKATGKRVIHLATHAFFLETGCGSVEASGRGIGGIVGEDQDAAAGISREKPRVIDENPLLMSGLVLARANHAGQAASAETDGILSAEELTGMDLRGTELVALSGCDTGLGTVHVGEGVFGLRRALEIAGARTVLMSLWPVPDKEAREWMEAFYRERLNGGSIVQSARDASAALLRGARESGEPPHPYLWAGFVSAGDWR